MNTSRLYLLALSLVPQLGPKRCRYLLRIFGDARDVFRASRRDFARISFINPEMAHSIMKGTLLKDAEEIIAAAEKKNMQVMDFQQPEYPQRLQHIPHPPVILYTDLNCNLNTSRVLAIVGTRKPTDRGLAQTEELVLGLSSAGVTIVSGLAYGIDACAHRAAIKYNLPTVGVLGGALDKIYPGQHRTLFEKMKANGGGLSEFPPGIKAEREHFPMRNRIIAGMSDVVIVVESGTKGGSMITARMANDYDREVGAMPGIIGDHRSSGCHLLIKNNESHLIENAADVMALMQWNESSDDEPTYLLPPDDEDQKRIYLGLKSNGPLHIDQLLAKWRLTPAQWSGISLSLELSGHIKILPGNVIKAV